MEYYFIQQKNIETLPFTITWMDIAYFSQLLECWKVPDQGTGGFGVWSWLQSVGLQRVWHDWSNLACMAPSSIRVSTFSDKEFTAAPAITYQIQVLHTKVSFCVFFLDNITCTIWNLSFNCYLSSIWKKIEETEEKGMLSKYMCMHAWYVASVMIDSETLWTVAHQAPLSMGFSRQEYRSGSPCNYLGDLPDTEIKLPSLMSPALAGWFFTAPSTWEAKWIYRNI